MKTRLNPFFRHGILVSSLAFCLGQAAGAADYTWTQSGIATHDWTNTANWSDGKVFVSGSTNGLVFFADTTTNLPQGSNNITTNVPTTLTLNSLTLNGRGPGTGATAVHAVTIGSSASTWTFDGTSPQIQLNGLNSTRGMQYIVAANLAFNQSTSISGNGTGAFTFSGGFSGGSSLVLTKSGSSILILSGDNSGYTGKWLISEGILQLQSGGNTMNSSNLVQVNSGASLRVNNSSIIAGLNDSAGIGGSVINSSGGGKTLTFGGAGNYNFAGNFTTGGSNKVGLILSGSGTQTLGGDNTVNTGYQTVTGSGSLVFAKQNSIFQGLATGAVVNTNSAANAGISVSSGGTVALGVGDSSSGYFDSAAIGTFLDGTHMGASSSTTGFRNSSIFGLDTTNATGGSFTYSTALTNIGTSTGIGFAKLGAGTLVLDAANTYGGVTQVRAGTLQLGSGGTSGSIGSSADVTVSSGAALAFNRSDNALTVANMITGEGSVVQRGSGMTTLSSSASNYSGGTSITGGTLRVNNAAAIGTGTVTFSGSGGQLKLNTAGTISNGILISGGAGISGQGIIDTDTAIHGTISGAITIDASPSISGAGHFGSSSAGSLTVSGVITSSVPVVWRRNTGIFSGGGTSYSALQIRSGSVRLGGHNGLATSATVAIGGDGAAILDLAGYNQSLVGITKGVNAATITNSGSSDSTLTITGTSTFSGVIQDGQTGKAGISVSGGSLTLGGANTYTGATSVSGGGGLIISGSLSTTTVSVGTGSSIGGAGTIMGRLTVDSGGFFAPGSSPGNLTLGGGLDLAGTYLWELGALSTANPGIDFDVATVTAGDVDLTGATLGLNLGAFAPSAVPFWQSNQTWSGILNNTGTGSLIGSFAAIDNSAWASLGSFSTTYSGNDVNLMWTAVPEPKSTAGFGIIGLILLLGRRRGRVRN